jgi:hypothetical protein
MADLARRAEIALSPATIPLDHPLLAGRLAPASGLRVVEPREAPLSREARRRIDEWLAMRSAAGVDSAYVFTGSAAIAIR